MIPVQVRKNPGLRAFVGMAGSPLAKSVMQKSDRTLRVAKSPDRTDPVAFEVWIDGFGQKHGRIDVDNAFQEYAFDTQLGNGVNPLKNSSVPSHAGALRPNDPSSPLQDLSLDPSVKVTTGLLEGERPLKRRRADKSWWIFDGKLLREFLRPLYNPKRMQRAEKAILILYRYYFQSRTDDEIFEEALYTFRDVKSVKEYRRAIVNRGAELFKDQKPESVWHGRRGVWDYELKAYDFSGRK